MDYTYLHQAAAVAQFDTGSVAGSSNSVVPHSGNYAKILHLFVFYL